MVDDFITLFIAGVYFIFKLCPNKYYKLLFIGQETTASTLSSAFLNLCQHPMIMNKLKEEVDSVVGSKTEIEFEDLYKLKYTGAVLKET